MKSLKYILLFIIILNIKTYSRDTLAIVSARDFELVAPDSLEFDLYLTKNTENWTAFANATLQLAFLDTLIKIDSTDLVFEHILNTSELPIFTPVGNQLPTDRYLIEPKIFKGRFSITIIGPEKYDDCMKLTLGQSMKLGRFSIKSLSGKKLPTYLTWLQPKEWYQALAYKRNQDSLIAGNTPFFYGNDNIGMDDGKDITFLLNIDKNPTESFSFKDFWVVYTGQMIDSLGWSTNLEMDVNGYFVKRGVRTSIFEVEYTDLVRTWVASDPKYNPGYVSKGYSKTGHVYNPFFDTVDYRGGEYCYSLWANMNRKDGSSFDTLLAQKCVYVPNAVISKANPLGNPFTHSTKVNLHLDDDCYVDGFVVDEVGKFVTTLNFNGQPMSNLFMKKSPIPIKPEKDQILEPEDERGGYDIEFIASSVASQGLYNVVFIAYPISDKNVEVSKAVVKLQLVKDGSK